MRFKGRTGIAVVALCSLAPLGCGPPAPGPTVVSQAGGHRDARSLCVASLQNPAKVLPGMWDAVYVDRDGTGENPPYTGPRTFSLHIWTTPKGLRGTMSYPMRYQTVTLFTSSISIVGNHVMATAPDQHRIVTVQGVLQCPGPVLDGNKTVNSDPDVTPLRFEKRPGA
jgi:hypothetical protein